MRNPLESMFPGMFGNENENQSGLALNQTTGKEQLKRYFAEVIRLHDGGEEFPVDFDDVWALAYSTKSNAVKALKNDELFLEGVHYQCLIQKKQNKTIGGDNRSVKYMLSVSCFEFFIASRVRMVFEVYRKVFHTARKQAALPFEKLKGLPKTRNINDRVMYPYRELLLKLGISPGGGAYSRARRYPGHFVKYDRVMMVSREMGQLIYMGRTANEYRAEIAAMPPVLPANFGTQPLPGFHY